MAQQRRLDVRRFPESIQVPGEPIPVGMLSAPIPETLEERQLPELPIIRQYRPTASEDYRQLLSEVPERESPGLLRKILAGAAGASSGYFEGAAKGIETGTNIMEEPYRRKLQDYSTRVGIAQRAAQEEQRIAEEGRQQQELELRGRQVGAQEKG